jgi:hypothetical protein
VSFSRILLTTSSGKSWRLFRFYVFLATHGNSTIAAEYSKNWRKCQL